MAETDSTTEVSTDTARTLARWLEAARSTRGLVTLALLLAMTVSSLEQTVVTTAMPSIIAQLRGLDVYPWVFTAYLLATTIATPIYGKLADLHGRKGVLLFGLGLFTLGSAMSGSAQSMTQLIVMRAIQGLGAGAIGPIVLTMLADMFSLEERARVQGLFSTVWGVSCLVGPAIGGVLTVYVSWRWVFFVTVPFSLISAWILIRHVHETSRSKLLGETPPIDWSGAALLSAGSTLLLLSVLRGHEQSVMVTTLTLVAAFGVLAAFVWNEHNAADPLLPLDLLLTPNIAASVAGSVIFGALFFGIDTFIPLFIQGVKGGDAMQAGRAITPMFLTWAVSVVIAARVVVRLGFRRTALTGSAIISLGILGLVFGAADPARSGPWLLVGMIVIGLGMAPTSLALLLDVQNTVARARRGTVTGAVILARTMGGALGVGILGAVMSLLLGRRLVNTPGVDVTAALRPETHALLAPSQLSAVQDALGRTLADVFLMMLALALLMIGCALGLRGGRAVSHADAGARPASADEELDLTVAVEQGVG